MDSHAGTFRFDNPCVFTRCAVVSNAEINTRIHSQNSDVTLVVGMILFHRPFKVYSYFVLSISRQDCIQRMYNEQSAPVS